MFKENMWFDLKTASTGALRRPGLMPGFIAAFVGPLVLLAIGGRYPSNLPWYFWGVVAGLLVTVVVAGVLMFSRDRDVGRDISINPTSRRYQ
jgi:hypothetical protein